jgi:hypothetical protein
MTLSRVVSIFHQSTVPNGPVLWPIVSIYLPPPPIPSPLCAVVKSWPAWQNWPIYHVFS